MTQHPNLLRHHAELLFHHYQNQLNQVTSDSDEVDREDLRNLHLSIQQLQHVLKDYQPHLAKRAKKHRGDLEYLNELIHEHLENTANSIWLKEKQKSKELSAEGRLGVEILLEYLPEAEKLKRKKLHTASKKINKPLESFTKKIKFKKSFNSTTAEILTEFAQNFKLKLTEFKKDKSLAHQVYIRAMRLRYTFELLESSDVSTLVKSLKMLQDLLDDTHNLKRLLKRVDYGLKREVNKWSQDYLDALKTNRTQSEPKRVFALSSLRINILTQIENNHKVVEEHWLSKSTNTFFKDATTAIKTLKKTPDSVMTEVPDNKHQDA